MRLAVISDIHGNLAALETVLADIDRQGVDDLLCLGDLVGYGASPNEVIEIVRGRSIPTIMGNYDDGVGFDRDNCGCQYKDPRLEALGDQSLAWTKEHVPAENKAYLRTLLPSIRRTIEGHEFLFVHGSPRKLNEYVYEDRPIETLERIAASAKADVLVFGHTHLPYQKKVGSVLFVNTGTVGKPKDRDTRAGYVIFDILPQQVSVEFLRLPYDVEAAARAVETSGLPHEFAWQLREARGDLPTPEPANSPAR
ncbi:MAG: metallophosphoesterase family protein [Anaerolineae bacterium]